MNIVTIIEKFWEQNTILKKVLSNCSSNEDARASLKKFVAEKWDEIENDTNSHKSLELIIQSNALNVLRRIISQRAEKISNFSIVSLIWNIFKRNTTALPESFEKDFLEEITHLFMAINGETGIYDNIEQLEFKNKTGHDAAVLRSGYLNKMSRDYKNFIKRYPDGLKNNIIEKRNLNKNRILKQLNANGRDWEDYKWHLKNVIRDSKTLSDLIELTDEEKKSIDLAKKIKLPFGITPYYVSLIDKEPSRVDDHAVRAQVIPPLHYVKTMESYKDNAEHSADFMLERDTSPENLITRRYPSIAIFKPFNTCGQICVYCQRNWQITDVLDPDAAATQEEMETAYRWFEANKEVDEILITGGDPFIMNTSSIRNILTRFSQMGHVRRIRFGTRTPVVLPQRIDTELADTISEFHEPGKREIAIITHVEHVYEVTPEMMKAVQMFKKRGISVYNQAVFTVENSRKFELVALRLALRDIGIDSYYTFNTKGKEETKNYRVPIARLQQEVKEEARLAPGLVRTDEPVYNVPKLGKNYIKAGQHHTLISILPNGKRIYEFHPWEKYISNVETYIDTDVSIYKYLEELKRRGEDIEDYKTIWYYY